MENRVEYTDNTDISDLESYYSLKSESDSGINEKTVVLSIHEQKKKVAELKQKLKKAFVLVGPYSNSNN